MRLVLVNKLTEYRIASEKSGKFETVYKEEKVYINPDYIVQMRESTTLRGKTTITMLNGDLIVVTDTVDDILSRL